MIITIVQLYGTKIWLTCDHLMQLKIAIKIKVLLLFLQHIASNSIGYNNKENPRTTSTADGSKGDRGNYILKKRKKKLRISLFLHLSKQAIIAETL